MNHFHINKLHRPTPPNAGREYPTKPPPNSRWVEPAAPLKENSSATQKAAQIDPFKDLADFQLKWDEAETDHMQKHHKQVYSELVAKLILKYGEPIQDFALRDRINEIQSLYPNPSALHGLRVLDIGCGSSFNTAEVDANRGLWSPWFLRACAELGANGVGIDIGDNYDEEPFTFYQVDLRQTGALDFLPSASFDFIHCTNLFNSPHLIHNLRYGDTEQRKLMIEKILTQIRRLFVPGGGLYIETELHG
jgi:SAM-dependent methyltransferase